MVSMKAPSAVTPGSPVKLPDGTSVTVDASGYVSVDPKWTSVLLNGGFQLVTGSETVIALADGHILVGNASGVGTDVALSGDATMADTGALSIATTKLATSENSYIKTDSGVKDLLVAAAAARKVIIVVTVTTVFANGDGAQPTLTIGEESGSATKFAAAAKFTNAAAGATFAFAGTLTSGKKLQATLVAGTGTTETGAYTIDVIAVG